MFQLPSNSRLFKKFEPANNWQWQDVLLNKANTLLDIIVWQNANQGVKKSKQSKKPDPFIPEFLKHFTHQHKVNKDIVSLDTREIDNILAMPRI